MTYNEDQAFTKEMRATLTEVASLLKSFLRRRQAGALVSVAYANPEAYTNLVRAADEKKTDYFLSRSDFEGPALKQMGDVLAAEQPAPSSRKVIDMVQRDPAIKSVFEIGPGTGEKILHLLNSKLGKDIQQIGFIDKQASFTDAATRGIKRENSSIHVVQISQDFHQEAGRHKFSSRVAGLILGGTISNVVIDGYPNERSEYPHDQFVHTFKILSQYYSEEGGSLLVSADTSDIPTMLNVYRDRPGTSYNADFNLNSIEFIEHIFADAAGLAPEGEKDRYAITIKSSDPQLQKQDVVRFRDVFRAETRYFSKGQLAAHCLVTDYPCAITVGRSAPIELEAGWYNATIISAKPRAEQLIDAAEQTGKFEFKKLTRNEEQLGEREARRVDLLRFDFKKAAEAVSAGRKPANDLQPRPQPLALATSAFGLGGRPAFSFSRG